MDHPFPDQLDTSVEEEVRLDPPGTGSMITGRIDDPHSPTYTAMLLSNGALRLHVAGFDGLMAMEVELPGQVSEGLYRLLNMRHSDEAMDQYLERLEVLRLEAEERARPRIDDDEDEPSGWQSVDTAPSERFEVGQVLWDRSDESAVVVCEGPDDDYDYYIRQLVGGDFYYENVDSLEAFNPAKHLLEGDRVVILPGATFDNGMRAVPDDLIGLTGTVEDHPVAALAPAKVVWFDKERTAGHLVDIAYLEPAPMLSNYGRIIMSDDPITPMVRG
jgi:hypothetical protein